MSELTTDYVIAQMRWWYGEGDAAEPEVPLADPQEVAWLCLERLIALQALIDKQAAMMEKLVAVLRERTYITGDGEHYDDGRDDEVIAVLAEYDEMAVAGLCVAAGCVQPAERSTDSDETAGGPTA